MCKKYINTDKFELEEHPFPNSIPNNAKILIIGTFPSHKKNRNFNYYYSSTSNRFWPIMKKVFNVKFNDLLDFNRTKTEREKFLHSQGIGITDIVQMCYRRNECSSDYDIFPIKLLDLFTVLDKYQSIKKLVLTSRTEIFGAYGLVKNYFYQNDIEPFDVVASKINKDVLEGQFLHNGRLIKVVIPFSPSNSITNRTLNELVVMYKHCLI